MYNEPSRTNEDPNAWFNDGAPQYTPPPPPKKHSRTVILIVAIASILIIGVVGILILMPSSSSCLTKDDYALLTGNTYTDDTFSPKDNFYTSPLSFTDTNTTPDATDTTIQKIISFYTSRHSSRSILVTLSATYRQPELVSLTQNRLDSVQSILLKGGIASDAIQMGSNSYIAPDDAEIDAPAVNSSEITIAVTSATTCH